MDLSDDLRQAWDDIQAYYDELNGESSRAAVILAVASLEDELERLILKKFPSDLSPKVWKRVCGPGHSPLGSFKAKSDFAQAFGYFGKETRNLLENISVVRNKFAHASLPRYFTDDDILEACSKIFPVPALEGPHKPKDKEVRWQYIAAVRTTHEQLEQLAQHISELSGPIQPLP